MFFKVIIEGGHVGAGKSCEAVRYFEARDAITLFNLLKIYPGIKCKHSGCGISMIIPISEKEYRNGKQREKKDPYYSRLYFRITMISNCKLRPFFPYRDLSKLTDMKTRDYSDGGLGLLYRGQKLSTGYRVMARIDALEISDRKAEVVWSMSVPDGFFMSGLKWMLH